MGLSTSYNTRSTGRRLLRIGASLVLCGLTVLGRAEDTTSPQAANAPYSVTAPMAKLQVTGNAQVFSVDADHADAQSVLKAIFNQANAQFTTDNSVVGQVTMRLSGQSLTTTLDAVCKQLLIRYRKDAKGIYVFEQDPEAVKAAITRIKDQNVYLRQQLRSIGLSLPEDLVLDGAPGVTSPAGAAGGANALGMNPGGFGGGGANSNFARRGADLKANLPEPGRAGGRTQAAPDSARSIARPENGAKGDFGTKGNNYAQENIPLNFLTADDLARIFQLNSQNNGLLNPNDYLTWLKQNGLVYINTGDKKAPVTEVLQELGRQANTPILIDASVPRGPKFALQGYITPRTLPEALQVLTQSSRLTWRWLGGSVYVSALPDFQLFFNSTSPRVIFGGSGSTYPTNGGQGQQFNNNAYAPPSQAPLPITNGEKKTP